MRKFKAIISSICACALCMTAVPLSTSATSTQYLRGDTNGDSIVNAKDIPTLQQYLLGTVRITDASIQQRMDVNQDRIIDNRDMTYLRSIFLDELNPGPDTYSSSYGIPVQNNVCYYVFDANGDFDSLYVNNKPANLDATGNNTAPSTPQFQPVSGQINNQQTTENGLRGIVRTSTNLGLGTAFVVDDHTLLTCAHCFIGLHYDEWDPQNGYTYDTPEYMNLDFYSNATTIDTSITATVKYVHVPEMFLKSTNHWQYDYALIKVNEDLSDYVNFNLGMPSNNIKEVNPLAYVTGFFPGQKATTSGRITNISDRTIDYLAGVIGGTSGGPVYVKNGNTKTVIGINSHAANGYNYGTRITPEIISAVYNNFYLDNFY